MIVISKQLMIGNDAERLPSRKDGITNNSTDSESLIAGSDSPTTIESMLKVHQSEMVNLCSYRFHKSSTVDYFHFQLSEKDDEESGQPGK